jgi:hypothetical protein
VDIHGARKAGIKLNNESIFKKADWIFQIKGVYNLLFDLIHDDFPIRLETVAYVKDRIDDAFFMHHFTNKHNGALSTNSADPPSVPTQVIRTSMEQVYSYRSVNKNGLTESDVKVKPDPLFNEIGYGV